MKTIFILLATLFAFGFPLGLLIYWKKKTNISILPFFVGAICFLAFAFGLEQILHLFCVILDNPVSRAINNNTILYMLYGSFAAGIFEETARLFGFKKLLKNYDDPEVSIAYGIGHGGIETILVLGISYLMYLIIAFGLPIADETTTLTLKDSINLISIPYILVAILERIAAMSAHIGLSMIVYKTIKTKNIKWYLFAILLHAILDMPAALYQRSQLTIGLIEAITVIIAGTILFIGIKQYKKMKVETSINQF